MAELIKPGYDDTADIADINSNTDEFAARIANCKPKQTAKTDPSADGTSATFIATLTQNANGEVTATKKTVRTMTGATSSVAGATGLVPAPGTGDVGKFLKGNGQWAIPTNTTYSEATSSAYGLVKVGYTTSGKNYAVQLSSGKMYVNVPWTDNNTTYSAASSSVLGLIKIGYTQNNKKYPVQLDSSSKAYVEVPWTDNNTTYSQATSSALGLVKIGYSTNGKNYAVQLSDGKMYVNVPWTNTTYSNATQSTAGIMSASDKTKLDGIATGAQKNPGNATTSSAGLMSATDKANLDKTVTALGSMLSLVTNVAIDTSSSKTVNTYGGRKFSDYSLLVFILHDGSEGKTFSGSVTVPAALWTSGKSVKLIRAGSYRGIQINYSSDTAITASRIAEQWNGLGIHADQTWHGTAIGADTVQTFYIEIVGIKKV